MVGPTDPDIGQGALYAFITFDEGSEHVKAIPLKTKVPDETRTAYISMWGLERQKFAIFRTDTGGEFAGAFGEHLREQGTHHELSLPDRPTTNARIEAMNRRVCEATTASLIQAAAPYYFWGWAVTMTAKTMSLTKLNRKGEVPYMTLRGRDPNPSRAVPFGCQGFFVEHGHIDSRSGPENRRKFDPRATPGVIVGYAQLQGYTIMDQALFFREGKIRLVVTRDVRVFPEVFPLRRIPQQFTLASRVTMTRLLVGPEIKARAELLDDGTGHCIACAMFCEPLVVDCPACRGRRRAHLNNARCKKARCGGHTRAALIRAAEMVDPDIDRVQLLRDGDSDEVISVHEGVTPAHVLDREPHRSGRLYDDEAPMQGPTQEDNEPVAPQEGYVEPDARQALYPQPSAPPLVPDAADPLDSLPSPVREIDFTSPDRAHEIVEEEGEEAAQQEQDAVGMEPEPAAVAGDLMGAKMWHDLGISQARPPQRPRVPLGTLAGRPIVAETPFGLAVVMVEAD